MKLRTRLDVFSAALLSALGASSLVACGGSSVFTSDSAGAGGGGPGGAGRSGGPSVGGSGSAGSPQGGASAAGSTGIAGAAGSSNPYPCNNPKDLGNGLIQCDDFTHLEHSGGCESKVPRPNPVPVPAGGVGNCTMDSDCTAQPYGWCGPSNGGEIPGTFCQYGCKENSDCLDNQACICGDPVGRCVSVDCASNSECTPGFYCKGYDRSGGCDITNYTCQTAGDTCSNDADCVGSAEGTLCQYDLMQKRFHCEFGGCAIGRPFLVEGEQRQAPLSARADWCELALLPRIERVDAALKAHLAEQWARVALMEHASIAAFARFTLQLMSLGAPAELVELATSAMADETKHAKACFAVASRYGAAPVGPGRLAVESSLDQMSLYDITLNAILEGCIGETVAAIEAREAAEHCEDPALRALLLVISKDETRHAELAFRFVKWALSQGDATLERAVRLSFDALSREEQPRPVALDARGSASLRHGIAPEGMRQAIRAQAIRDVILPCSRALFISEARAARSVQRLGESST